MIKHIASIVLAGAFALALCSCAQVVSDINAVTGALSSPAANQAAANLKAGAAAVACTVASVDQVIQEVENDVGVPSKYAAVIKRDTKTVYVVSAAACAYFGGTSAGPVTVPTNAPAPIVPTAATAAAKPATS
jgi:hypothetical protein